MSNYLSIHSQISGAAAIVALGEQVVSCTWKQTANQTRKERAVILPMESLKAPEVPESFRALVEAVLLSSAQETLKNFVNQAENNFQIAADSFSRPQLVT